MCRILRFVLLLALASGFCFAQTTTQTADGKDTTAPQTNLPPVKAPEPDTKTATAAPELFPGDILGEAKLLYRKGEFIGAIGKFEEFVRDHPDSPDGYTGLVRTYLKQKNVERAAEFAEKGMAHTQSPRMKTAQAEVMFRQGKINEAEKVWVDVLNSGYPDGRAFLGLARVRNSIAMYKSEKAMLDKAHELDPNDSDIQEEWISTLSRAERIKYLEESLAGENNWDKEQRENAQIYLTYLKERAKQKNGPCRLANKVMATETPLLRLWVDPGHLRGYGLGVVINGHKSPLMLDTGASEILIKRSIAEHAGITRIAETKVGGVGDKGRRNGYFGIAESIKIGGLEFQNCTVEVIEGRNVGGEEGLIGTDVFEDFLVDIDFPNEKLKLSQLPRRPGEVEQQLALKSEDEDDDDDGDDDSAKTADGKEAKKTDAKAADAKTSSANSSLQDRYIAPEMQNYSHVYRFGHDLLIPTAIGKVPPKLFLIDTGALTNFISPAAAREVTKVYGDSDTIVKGISGKVENVYSANKAILTFGHLRQENQDMTAIDTKGISDDVGTEVSGFLGFTTLRFLDIKIDYRDALVNFDYDAKRWNR